VSLYATVLTADAALPVHVMAARSAYLHIARGEVDIDGQRLQAGDALMVDAASELSMRAVSTSEVLWFDLPQASE
jgi:quercetin 2,3-dioxygenase